MRDTLYAIGIERCTFSICGDSARYRPFFQKAFYDVGLFTGQRDKKGILTAIRGDEFIEMGNGGDTRATMSAPELKDYILARKSIFLFWLTANPFTDLNRGGRLVNCGITSESLSFLLRSVNCLYPNN